MLLNQTNFVLVSFCWPKWHCAGGPLLGTNSEGSVTIHDWFSCLASFTRQVFEVHPCCSMCQDFIPFTAEEHSIIWIHHIYLFLDSSADGNLSCFKGGTTADTAAVNIPALRGYMLPFLLDKYLRLRWLNHIVGECSTFRETVKLFPKLFYYFSFHQQCVSSGCSMPEIGKIYPID